MQAFLQNPVWFILLAANLYEFILMYYDKRQAVKHKWRVPESTLLFGGLIGGGIGGLLSQRIFRHKTRKLKFTIVFLIGIFLDVALMVYFGGS